MKEVNPMTTLYAQAPSARSNGHQLPIVHPIQLAEWADRTAAKPAVQPAAAATPTPEQVKLDADLDKAVRRSGYMRQVFYGAVLAIALGGQVSGAVEALNLPWYVAIGPVAALEIGAVVVLNNADVRRRLGERAAASRALSAAIAAGAVVFNWMAHANHLLGGFFSGMSALGYLVWLMHTENQRRDRLRAKGDLPPTTPAYELVGHWLRHPWLTLRAKNLAKADRRLGLYSSIAAAKAEIRQERRDAAIAAVVGKEIRKRSRDDANVALTVYELEEIATRLKDRADYDGLTDMIAVRLDPRRFTGQPTEAVRVESMVGSPILDGVDAAYRTTPREVGGAPTPSRAVGGPAHAQAPTSPTPTGAAHLGAQPTPTSTSQPTWAPTGEAAHLGAAPPTPNLGGQAQAPTVQPTPTQPKPPTKPKAAQPKTTAQAPTPIPGLTDLQQSRLADLAREFPGELPGRDKVMTHMREQGYEGWSSKQPATILINLLRAQRESAQGAKPTPTALVGDAQPSPAAHAHTPNLGAQPTEEAE
jgi:hypothetical protein